MNYTNRKSPLLYRALLHLYPAQFRKLFAEEMVMVFSRVYDGLSSDDLGVRFRFVAGECVGLLRGAIYEHGRLWIARKSGEQNRHRLFSTKRVFWMIVAFFIVTTASATFGWLALHSHGSNPFVADGIRCLLPGTITFFAIGISCGIAFALTRIAARQIADWWPAVSAEWLGKK